MPARTVFLIRSGSPNWDGWRAALDAMDDVTVVGDTPSAATARERVPAVQPEVVMSAIAVEGESAVPLLADLRAALPKAIIAVFSGRYTDDELIALAKLRISGYLLWDDLDDPTFSAAHDALLGGTFMVWSRAVAIALSDAVLRPSQPTAAVPQLTEQERAILGRLAEGDANKEIAEQLALSQRTVEGYVDRLRAKLGAKNRTHLAVIAVRLGLLNG